MFLLVLLVSCPVRFVYAGSQADETMLMFVGEVEPVVSVASRAPEEASTAPAIVSVVTREKIQKHGYTTLGQLLNQQPGIYVAPGGRGSVAYMRGMRDAILFLYDGVPLTSEVSRQFAPLDEELDLGAIERVEIVRGPGSVLWGADAFAGVVNIVPRQSPERWTHSALHAGSGEHAGLSFGKGGSIGKWHAGLHMSGTRQDYHLDNYMTQDVEGEIVEQRIDASRYAEASATLSYADWFKLSGRFSDVRRNYTMYNPDESLRWNGEKEAPSALIKASASTIIGPSHYTLTAYAQQIDSTISDADIAREQRNRLLNIELLWDRRIFGRGLVTVGASQRWNRVEGAIVDDGILPELLRPGQNLFVPNIEQRDFNTNLFSLFTQFRYRMNNTELWAGLRYDEHNQYSNSTSFSLGLLYRYSEKLRLKLAFASAYRSPYPSQLFGDMPQDTDSDVRPELIRTASAQLTWDLCPSLQGELTLFHNRLERHRVENPYGGLSLEGKQENYGVELAIRWQPNPEWDLRWNLSAIGDNDPTEDFRVLRYAYIRPDGTRVEEYDTWSQHADSGPGWHTSLALVWNPAPDYTFALNANKSEQIEYTYTKGTFSGSYSQPVLIDLTCTLPGMLTDNDSIGLHIYNLLDRSYKVPDVYGPTPAAGIRALLKWEYDF